MNSNMYFTNMVINQGTVAVNTDTMYSAEISFDIDYNTSVTVRLTKELFMDLKKKMDEAEWQKTPKEIWEERDKAKKNE